MLSSIKISDAERVFVEELENAESGVIHADILGFIWSSGFDPSEKLDVISRIATNGDYRAAMEGLTIIELCEGVGITDSIKFTKSKDNGVNAKMIHLRLCISQCWKLIASR